MRQQRVRMDQFDRDSLLQYHEQAVTHVLAPQQSQRQIPCQLVFPDDTMAIGSPPIARGQLFASDHANTPDFEAEAQRRLVQNAPVVVYTSLSDWAELKQGVQWRGMLLLFTIAVQSILIIVELTGGMDQFVFGYEDASLTGSVTRLYGALLALHVLFLLSMYLWNVDLLKAYCVLVTLAFLLILVLALRGLFDVLICALCVPCVLLGNSLRDLMMPHCFTVRG
uniref:Uncharacterized protein n=1 Tax=Noctiluca scintillans TaxID=2966 RepID=A0A7S1AUQ7_NOCSC|mmetsp:Transcript_59146/g.157398  ORF Transcript_59146/g.157398 Transcript_59146/m.157398 type:complete len:224 (+) Transcript_59146:77-748(+)